MSIKSVFRRETSSHFYLPEVDGIRFVAITLVIFYHINTYFFEKTGAVMPNIGASYWLARLAANGDRGVPLFFVLSGFILSLPFARHYITGSKKVDLKRYYLRRLTRLEPPYFIAMLLLFTALVLMKTQPIPLLVKSLIATLTYTHNIVFGEKSLITSVAWSLEVEVQFYLMAPLLFTVFRLRKTYRRLILVAACILFLYLQRHFPLGVITIYDDFQYFLLGVLISDYYVSGDFVAIKNSLMIKLLSTALLTAALFLPYKESMTASGLFLIIIFLLYLCILNYTEIKKVFGFGYIPIIGGMCYSIYLLHYAIISMIGRFTIKLRVGNAFLPNFLLQILILYSCIIIICSVFYLLVERPFMSTKWTDRLLGKQVDKRKTAFVPSAIENPAHKNR